MVESTEALSGKVRGKTFDQILAERTKEILRSGQRCVLVLTMDRNGVFHFETAYNDEMAGAFIENARQALNKMAQENLGRDVTLF